jgi:hypothetical protein
MTTDTVRIRVGTGDNVKEFVIHKRVLTARSDFFVKALEKHWKEGEDKVVELPEDDIEIFNLYRGLVYSQHLSVLLSQK